MRREDATDAAPRSRFDRVLASAALLVWIAVTATISVRHEPWRDEADAWLVARDADVVTFIRHTSLSGTPALWRVILLPLARGGAPYDSQKAVHLAIAAATAALILFRSPFHWLTRLAAVFSYFFAYEYAVVVQDYALTVLLLLLIALWYPTRGERPYRYAALVALLANGSTHGLFIAAFLGLFFAYENIRAWKPILIMLAGGLLSVAQLASALGERGTTHLHLRLAEPAGAIGSAFLPLVDWNGAPLVGLVIVASATWWLWRRDRLLIALLWCCFAALMLIFTFWWFGGVRHAGLLLVVVLAVLWMARTERSAPVVLLTLALLVSDVSAFRMMRDDYRDAFSGSKDLAAFLYASGLDRVLISAHSETTTSSVAPYLSHPLWYAGIDELGTFNMWDRKFDKGLDVTYPDAVARTRRRFDGHALMLLNVEVPDPAAEGLQLIYRTRVRVFAHPEERYWLYRFVR